MNCNQRRHFGYGYTLKPYLDHWVNNARITADEYDRVLNALADNTYYQLQLNHDHTVTLRVTDEA